MPSHAFIPAVGCVHVSFIGSLAGQLIVNHMDFDHLTSLDAGAVAQIGNDAAGIWNDSVVPQLSQDYMFDHVHAVDLDDVVGFTYDSPLAGTTGGIASPTEANNVAQVVTYRTGIRGRSFRGRTYLAGVPQSKRVSGIAVDSSWVASLLTAFTVFLTHTYEATAHPVVLSYMQNHAWLTNAQISRITEFTATNVIDAQRRRLGGRGA